MADIRRFGDRLQPDLKRSFLSAISSAVNLVDEAEVEALLLARDIAGLRTLAQRLATEGFINAAGPFLDTFEQIFRQSAGSILLNAEIPRFDTRVQSYLQGRPAFFLEGLARDVTLSVRQTIERSYTAGENVPTIARKIRQSIGILPAHELAVERFRQSQIADGIRTEAVERNTQLYRDRLLDWRANMISRTETLTAAHAGQLEAWKEHLETGRLLYSRTWVEWDVTEDDRLCERCAPMDGQRIRIGDVFTATHKGFPDGVPEDTPRTPRRKGGIKPGTRKVEHRETWLDGELVPLKRPISVTHPPLHPNCRCTMKLKFDRNL